MHRALGLLVLAACHAQLGAGDSVAVGGEVPPDAEAAPSPDADLADATAANAENECGIAANQGDLGSVMGSAGSDAQDATTAKVHWVLARTPLTAREAKPDMIFIELWDGYGPFEAGAARTGTFTIAADSDYDTCGVCVLMAADVEDSTAKKLLLATAGTVTVTSIAEGAGDTTQITVTDASFVEINYVDNQGYQTVTDSSCPSPITRGEVRGSI